MFRSTTGFYHSSFKTHTRREPIDAEHRNTQPPADTTGKKTYRAVHLLFSGDEIGTVHCPGEELVQMPCFLLERFAMHPCIDWCKLISRNTRAHTHTHVSLTFNSSCWLFKQTSERGINSPAKGRRQPGGGVHIGQLGRKQRKPSNNTR